MFQELRDVFTVTLAKRLTSPFISTFLFAWCVANYDVILLVFSGTDWQTKIVYIKSAFSPTWTIDYLCNFIWRFVIPIGVTFFYVLAWPWCDMWFYKKNKIDQIKYKNEKMLLEKLTPISEEDKEELNDKFEFGTKRLREELYESDAKISEYKVRYKDNTDSISKLNQELKKALEQSKQLAAKLDVAEQEKEELKKLHSLDIIQHEQDAETARDELENYHLSNMDSNNDQMMTNIYAYKAKISELNDEVTALKEAVGVEKQSKINPNTSDAIDEQIREQDELSRKMKVPPENIESKEPDEMVDKSEDVIRNITIKGGGGKELYELLKEDNNISEEENTLSDSPSHDADLNTIKVASKYYNFTYTISDNVIKQAERLGITLSKKQELNFTRDDISDEVYNNLLDIYYIESENGIGPDMHLFLRFADTEAENWESKLNPEKASIVEVLTEWSKAQDEWKKSFEEVSIKTKEIEGVETQDYEDTSMEVISWNGEGIKNEKPVSEVDLPIEESSDNTFTFSYKISDETRRLESKSGNFIPIDYNFTVLKDDLPQEIRDTLHDIYYNEYLGKTNPNITLGMPSFSYHPNGRLDVRFIPWDLNQNPTPLSSVELLNIWSDDFLRIINSEVNFKAKDLSADDFYDAVCRLIRVEMNELYERQRNS